MESKLSSPSPPSPAKKKPKKKQLKNEMKKEREIMKHYNFRWLSMLKLSPWFHPVRHLFCMLISKKIKNS